MAEKFDPYYKWLGIPPKDQPPHHYRLLGIELFEEDRDVIDAAANRVMAYLKDLATGDEAAHSQKLLNEIAQARICLLNRDRKAAYDQQLRARFEASRTVPEPAEWPVATPPPLPGAAIPTPPVASPIVAAPPWEAPPVGAPEPPSDGGSSGAIDLARMVASVREAPGARPGRRPRSQRPPDKAAGPATRPLVRVGFIGGAVGLLLAVVLLAWSWPGKSKPPRETGSPAGHGPARGQAAALVLVLSEQERKDLKLLTIDGMSQQLPPRDAYPLNAGEHHLLLQRVGYADVRETIRLDEGTRREVRPRWRATSKGPTDASRLLSTRDPPFATPSADGFCRGFGRQVAHWSFDDNLDDRSGNSAGAQATGSPVFVEGRFGKAFELKPDQSVAVNKPLIAESGEFTIAGWLKPTAVPPTDAAVLDGGGVKLHLQDGYPQVRVGPKRPRAGKHTDAKSGGFNGFSLSQHLNQWTHVAVVYSARARQVHYYLNGEHRGHQSLAGGPAAKIGSLTIGHLQGAVDELRVFDYRLGNTDILALHDGSFRPLPSPPSKPDEKVVCHTWYDVAPGLSRAQVELLLAQRAPDETAPLGKELCFVGPRGDTDYLTRVRGFVFPRESGEYAFTLQTPGEAALYVQRPGAAKETVAEVVTSHRGRVQESAPLQLEAGRACYFEILCQYSSRRASNLRVAWKRVGIPGSQPAPIPSTQLAHYPES